MSLGGVPTASGATWEGLRRHSCVWTSLLKQLLVVFLRFSSECVSVGLPDDVCVWLVPEPATIRSVLLGASDDLVRHNLLERVCSV